MTKQVKLEADVISMLALQANSTYKDPVAFLDEAIQNADRAGAKNVYVTVDRFGDKIEIFNDGAILDDPQSLFSMGKSKWSAEVVEQENPFGMGFFSNVSVAAMIQVESGTNCVTFDRDKTLNTRQLDIPTEEINNVDGFRLILTKIAWDKISTSLIKERVELLGKFIQNVDIYYNGEITSKADIYTPDDSKFSASIRDHKLFSGWLSLRQGFSGDLKIYNKGRLVTKLTDFWYAAGELHLTPGALNLTAPDRKDFIRDSKYYAFKDAVTQQLSNLAIGAIINGTQQDISQHASSISQYANKAEAIKHMKFRVFIGGDEEQMKLLDKIVFDKEQKEDSVFGSYPSDMEAYIKAIEQPEPEEIVTEHVVGIPEEKGGYSGGYGGSSYPSDATEEAASVRKAVLEDNMDAIKSDTQVVFWVEEKDLVKYPKKIKLIKYYDLHLIVARNELELELLRRMDSDGVLHIDELEEEIDVEAVLSNRKLSNKEFRAMQILEMVSRLAGFKDNVFEIGDLMVTTTVNVRNVTEGEAHIDENAVAIVNSTKDKVLLDRTLLNVSVLDDDAKEELTLCDYKFILANLNNIVRQLKFLENCPSGVMAKILHGLAVN